MKKRVFILEENPDLRALFIILLEEEGYSVSAFPNINLLKKVVESSLPDLFILDISLPDGNVIDVCHDLKSSFRTSHIPVIMMSANSNLADIKNTCTAEDFISKPFDINLFIKKVNFYVENPKRAAN